MQAYESELRPYPHSRSIEMMRIMAQRWGSIIGVEYAEAFRLVRWVK